jgi:hypothetical protein
MTKILCGQTFGQIHVRRTLPFYCGMSLYSTKVYTLIGGIMSGGIPACVAKLVTTKRR